MGDNKNEKPHATETAAAMRTAAASPRKTGARCIQPPASKQLPPTSVQTDIPLWDEPEQANADDELDLDPVLRRPVNALPPARPVTTACPNSGEGKLKVDRHALRVEVKTRAQQKEARGRERNELQACGRADDDVTDPETLRRLKHRKCARADAERIRQDLLNDSSLAAICATCPRAGATLCGIACDYGRCLDCNVRLAAMTKRHNRVIVGYHLSGADDDLAHFGPIDIAAPVAELGEDSGGEWVQPPREVLPRPKPLARTRRARLSMALGQGALPPVDRTPPPPPPPPPPPAPPRPPRGPVPVGRVPRNLRHVQQAPVPDPTPVLAGVLIPDDVIEDAISEFTGACSIIDISQTVERISMPLEQRLVTMRNVPAEKQEINIVRVNAEVVVIHWFWAAILPQWRWLLGMFGALCTAELHYCPHVVAELLSLVGPYSDGDKIRTNGVAYVNRLASLPLPDYMRELVVHGSIVVAANMPQRAVSVAELPVDGPLNILRGRRRPTLSGTDHEKLGLLTHSRSFSTTSLPCPAAMTFGRAPRTIANLTTMSRFTPLFLLTALMLILSSVACVSVYVVMSRLSSRASPVTMLTLVSRPDMGSCPAELMPELRPVSAIPGFNKPLELMTAADARAMDAELAWQTLRDLDVPLSATWRSLSKASADRTSGPSRGIPCS